MANRFPILRALVAQVASYGLVAWGVQLASRSDIIINPLVAIATQAGMATAFGYALSLRRWWMIINLLLGPLLMLLLKMNLPPWVYLVSFVGLLLLYSNSITKGVPLYLSGGASLERVRQRLPGGTSEFRFIDLGCGLGSAVCYLAGRCRHSAFVGVENAPLVYFIAKFRALFHPNLSVKFASIWQVNWAEYDVVYCFLSPVPMADVWRKARREMKPGSLLISNTFDIPGVSPHETIEVDDWRHSKVFIWRM